MAGRFNSILSGSLVFSNDGVFASSIVPHPNALTITGSVKISGSNLILNGSDVGLRITTLESGQGADQIKFGAITLWTASISEWTGSTNQYIANLNDVSGSLNLFTGSVESRVSSLETSSSLENVSSSLLDSRLTTIESKPLVSSSAQIDALGFLSSSITGIVSRSAQISDLGFITGSKFSDLDDIPSGIVSSSTQIDELFDIDGLISSSEQIEQLLPFTFKQTGSYGSANTDIQITGSFNLSLDGISKYFSIDINGEEKVKVNEEGVFQLISQSASPTPVEGGIYYGNDHNLYLGVND